MRRRLLPTLAILLTIAFALSFWHGVTVYFPAGMGLFSVALLNGSVTVALGQGHLPAPYFRAALWDPSAGWWWSLLAFGAERAGPSTAWRVRFWFPLLLPIAVVAALAVRSWRRPTVVRGFAVEVKHGA